MKEEQCQVLYRPHDRIASQSSKQGSRLLRLVWQEGAVPSEEQEWLMLLWPFQTWLFCFPEKP